MKTHRLCLAFILLFHCIVGVSVAAPGDQRGFELINDAWYLPTGFKQTEVLQSSATGADWAFCAGIFGGATELLGAQARQTQGAQGQQIQEAVDFISEQITPAWANAMAAYSGASGYSHEAMVDEVETHMRKGWAEAKSLAGDDPLALLNQGSSANDALMECLNTR